MVALLPNTILTGMLLLRSSVSPTVAPNSADALPSTAETRTIAITFFNLAMQA